MFFQVYKIWVDFHSFFLTHLMKITYDYSLFLIFFKYVLYIVVVNQTFYVDDLYVTHYFVVVNRIFYTLRV